MKENRLVAAVVLVLALSVCIASYSACKPNEATEAYKKTFSDVVKKVLYGSKQGFEAVQYGMVGLKRAGKITDEQWAEWRIAEDKYIASHNAATKAYNEWLVLKDLSGTQIIAHLISEMFNYLDIATKLWEAWRK